MMLPQPLDKNSILRWSNTKNITPSLIYWWMNAEFGDHPLQLQPNSLHIYKP